MTFVKENEIFNKYLYRANNLKIIGICTSKENIEQLKNNENFGINAPVSNENIKGKNQGNLSIGCHTYWMITLHIKFRRNKNGDIRYF